MFRYIPNTPNNKLFSTMEVIKDEMEKFKLAEEATDYDNSISAQECLKEFHTWLSKRNPYDKLRCPKCGDKVFVISLEKAMMPIYGTEAKEQFKKEWDDNNPSVWCSDMGHWAGKVSECKISNG